MLLIDIETKIRYTRERNEILLTDLQLYSPTWTNVTYVNAKESCYRLARAVNARQLLTGHDGLLENKSLATTTSKECA